MRAVILSAAVATGVATFAATPSGTAHAGYYCGWIIPANSWCSAGYREGVYRNRAKYPGAGTVRVGISIYHPIAQNWWYTYYANNFVAKEWFCPFGGHPHVANASGHRHTVEGRYRATHAVCTSLPDPGIEVDVTRELAEMVDTTYGSLEVLRRDGDVDLAATTINAAGAAIEAGHLVDISAARLARVGESNERYIVAPGASTCLFRETPDGSDVTCSTMEQIDRGESVVVSERTEDLRDGQVRIAGLAPDGVTAARVQLVEGGPVLEIPVINNVFVTEARGDAAKVPTRVTYAWQGDSGDDGGEDPSELEPIDESGGCAAGGTGTGLAGGLLLVLGMLFARRRRR